MPRSRPVDVLFAAEALLEAVAGGERVLDERVVALARAVLGMESVQLAAALLAREANSPRRLGDALRVAAAVVEDFGNARVADKARSG